MAKYKRIITAGPLVVEAVYPAPHPRDPEAVRRGKKALSSQAQQRMNLIYAWQRLELLIAANFSRKDLFITLTYDDVHLPGDRKEALNRINSFVKQLRKVRRINGQALRYIYVTEHKHGEGRWHHHFLINATGEDYEDIRKLWGQGGVEFRSIRVDKEKHFETLARYLCKEQRDKVGQRLWSGSRNLCKPQRDCFRVPDDTPLKPPPKSRALLLADTGDVTTAYGHYRYIKYIVQNGIVPQRSRVKRRRRKK